MSATKPRLSSFSRNVPNVTSSQNPGLKHGPNGTTFVSSGIPDLDKILGGGFSLGSLVMVMEDAEAPHHLLLLRNFMSQGLVHKQPLLYASPSRDPRGFLGTLPNPQSFEDEKSREHDPNHDKDLRIAWQYKKYFGEAQLNTSSSNGARHDYCNDFDLRKPLERQFFNGVHVDCISIKDLTNLTLLQDQCATFLAQFSRNESNISPAGRIAIQSFCSPQCEYSNMEWQMLSFIRSLKSVVRSSKAVVVVTFPPSLPSPSCSKRLQHMADTLLSVRAIPDEDKEMAKLLTGYQDMVGLLNIHKVARINTQHLASNGVRGTFVYIILFLLFYVIGIVGAYKRNWREYNSDLVPLILEATTFSIKLQKRRVLVLECLNQAPVDGSSGNSYGTSGGCSGSIKVGPLDF